MSEAGDSNQVWQLANRQTESDFSLVLLRTIQSIKTDPAHFRNLVYEMARVALQKEAWHRDPPMNILEFRRMMLALETAIERVETESSARDAVPLLSPAAPNDTANDFDARLHDPIVLINQAPAARFAETPDDPSQRLMRARMRASMGALARFALLVLVAAVMAAGIVKLALVGQKTTVAADEPRAAVERKVVPQTQQVAIGAQSEQAANGAQSQQSTIAEQQFAAIRQSTGPLPSVYGVYALAGGKLYELEALQGRVPDQRVFMSAMINAPSHTTLPNGAIRFIVYRRDVAANAPDRVTVRVVAKVARDLTFDKEGRAKTAKLDNAWAIRNVQFNYRVAPSNDSPEMIVIRPDDDSFVLTPGRYVLVVKGLAYDFTIDGRVTEMTHCLERTQAANGTFYSECRTL